MEYTFEDYDRATQELKAVEAAKGYIPDWRYNSLLAFAEQRAEEILDFLYPDAS